jgi:hypothetical protein
MHPASLNQLLNAAGAHSRPRRSTALMDLASQLPQSCSASSSACTSRPPPNAPKPRGTPALATPRASSGGAADFQHRAGEPVDGRVRDPSEFDARQT